ncbi:BMA-DPF-3, isoform a [Aphelenchoides bicaudatus]|nr:BMA-DPF-3, isoform a [Aphelenchoides bicaudatus]
MFTPGGNYPPKTWADRINHANYWRREVKRSFGDNISHLQLLENIQIGDRQLGPVLIGLGSLPTKDATPPVQTLVFAELNEASDNYLELKPMLNTEDFGPSLDESKRPSAELTLFFERTRSQIANGILSYYIHPASQRLLLSTSNGIFVYKNGRVNPIAEWCSGEPMNAVFCPSDPDYIAFCAKGQLHIDKLNNKVFTTASDDFAPGITNGLASFVVQEELERDEGFWWNPHALELVYERVDSRAVTELAFTIPGKQPQESMHYPLAGTENAKSHLHLVTYDEKSGRFVDRPLLTFIEKFIPDYEYIACAGWTNDGDSFYVIVMNRAQTKRSVLLIGREAFTFSSCEPLDLPIRLIYEEESNIWVNNNQLTAFLPSTPEFKFIYGSEKSDLCHLYMRSFQGNHELAEDFSITAGEWSVIKVRNFYQDAKPTVDHKRQQIYYLANPEFPGSTALCVSSYKSPYCLQHRILTPSNLCYKFDRADTDLNVKPELGFVCCLSSVKRLPEIHFYALIHSPNDLLPTAQFQYKIRLQPAIATPISNIIAPDAAQPDVPMSPASNQVEPNEQPLNPEELFSHGFCEVPLADGKTVLHCLVLLPTHNPNHSQKFPVIHYVYGGPASQLVKNSWIGVSQFLKFIKAGYAVFLADGRGSCNRGVHFESAIKFNMGSVEVEDQVHALKYAAEHFFPLLDVDRIGVTGWSYGGYMSLQMIAQHPQLYKCSIAGGSVVEWDLYDSAYTERYMGKPAENVEGYKNASVLSRIASLPDEENRLLIVHGLIDENVHFSHIEKLINALVNAGKPHKLLIFPSERHGIRKAESVEYLHASMIGFFDQNLKPVE